MIEFGKSMRDEGFKASFVANVMGKRFGPEIVVTAPIYNIGICTPFKKREKVF
jgi:hypothetical protein